MAGKAKTQKVQTGTLRKVLHYMQRYWLLLALSICLAAVSVVLTLAVPILVGRAIDQILGKDRVNFQGILSLLLQIGVIVGVTALLQWVMNTLNNKVTFQVIRDVRDEAFRKIEILPLKYIDGHAYGEIVSRVIADVDQFADGLLLGFAQLFTGVVTIVGTLLFMLFINWQIALVVVLLTPLSLLVARFIAQKDL